MGKKTKGATDTDDTARTIRTTTITPTERLIYFVGFRTLPDQEGDPIYNVSFPISKGLFTIFFALSQLERKKKLAQRQAAASDDDEDD